MVERTVQIADPIGLHARVAAGLTQLAQSFSAEISLHTKEKSASAKSIISLLMLDLGQGSQVLLRAQGADETIALAAAADYLTRSGE